MTIHFPKTEFFRPGYADRYKDYLRTHFSKELLRPISIKNPPKGVAYIDLAIVKSLSKPEGSIFVPDFTAGKNAILKGKLESSTVVWEIVEGRDIKHNEIEGINDKGMTYKQNFNDKHTLVALNFSSKDPNLYCMNLQF